MTRRKPQPESARQLDRLAVARSYSHQPGCQCRVCREARAVWDGRIDEAEALLEQYSFEDIERLVTAGVLAHVAESDEQLDESEAES